MITPNQLRQKYLDYYLDKGHIIIPSSPIVPQNDPTTLFTSAGMQPLLPYFLGEPHPLGTRIVNSQRCFRSEDIEAVGDNRHTTYFEMLGNWSFGDYFKNEQLRWFFKFLTQELGLEPQKLYVTVYAGNPEIAVPKDIESIEIWQELFKEAGIDTQVVSDAAKQGLQNGRIFYYEDSNWWSRSGAPQNMPVGEPGGPDSEVFYDFGEDRKIHELSVYNHQACHVNCDCGRFLEIGNSVFMQYKKIETGFEPLPKKNVDFGGGFERILAVLNNDPDIFTTTIFLPLIQKLETIFEQSYHQEPKVQPIYRTIADHLRAVVMLASDGVEPDNKEQGYFSRRLLRRSMRYARRLGKEEPFLSKLVPLVAKIYEEPYPEILKKQKQIQHIVETEERQFVQTLNRALKAFNRLVKGKTLSGKQAFYIYETHGLPLELIKEMAADQGVVLDIEGFKKEQLWHQEQSRKGAEQKFKGGLADHSEAVTRLHTATHLLHQTLRQVLGTHVHQVGSNITDQRLRFDFTHQEKLTDEEIKTVEALVNQQIEAKLPVNFEIKPLDEALNTGALAFFGERYPEKVKVYTMGEFSKEICGGPHVTNTSELGKFKLGKQEAVGTGKRRIYGYLVV